MSVMNLLMLSHLVDEPAWTERLERTLAAFRERLEQLGRGVPMMAAALSTCVAGVQQIVIIQGQEGPEGQEGLERGLGKRYLPFAIRLRLTAERQRRLSGSVPFIAAMKPLEGKTSIYVCRDRTCRAPVTTLDELEGVLVS